jgi:hypothetical protein
MNVPIIRDPFPKGVGGPRKQFVFVEIVMVPFLPRHLSLVEGVFQLQLKPPLPLHLNRKKIALTQDDMGKKLFQYRPLCLVLF